MSLSKVKNNYDYQNERFECLKKLYKKFGIPFKTIEYNSVKEIETNLKKIRISLNNRKVEGVHLTRVFSLNSVKRIKEGLYVCKNTDTHRRNVKTIYYNEKACMDSMGCELKAIDINSCYWNTSLIIGVIDAKTHKTGFKKDREYKDARNVAIGSLGKNRNIIVFNGVEETENYYSPMETACIRLDIIDHVYNMSLKISKALGDDFAFYLTDCFFVKPEAEQKCIELIQKEGYTCKVNTIKFKESTQIDRRTFAIKWLKEGKLKDSTHHFNRVRHEISEQKPICYE